MSATDFKTNFGENENLEDMILSNKSELIHYISISSPETLDEFKYYIAELLNNTDNNDLKLGLKIILALISHEKQEVVASSLGRLYLIIQDECIRRLILKELNEMSYCKDISLKASVEDSLDIIIDNIYK
ncbi:MAG: hypothetical protein PHY59_06485 [Methanobacterium sp.]|nr:hypothetical protein [Methanobacterium sp.]